MSDYRIERTRPEPDELDLLVAIYVDAFERPPWGERHRPGDVRKALERMLAYPEAVMLIAFDADSVPLGAAIAFAAERKPELEARLARQMKRLKEWTILVKFGGATGNWNAHVIAFPDADWLAFGKRFIEGLNEGYEILLELNPITTQIESHDTYAELFDTLRRINVILTDLSQDMWRYISDGWIRQKQKEGEVGSSTMPHKINPIDFENAEGNLGVASALFEHYCRKLPISRLQRDLSDSTVERTFGTAFAHALIGFKSLMRGLEKIEVNAVAMLEDLKKHPEVLAEAIQTVLRREGADMPYEKLKTLTRGREITLEELHTFIDGLSIGDDVKERLKSLRPENYIGLAADTARQ